MQRRQRALLDTLLHEAQRMNRLIGNLLDLTRLREGGIELHDDRIAVDELIGAVLARLRDLLASHPIKLHLADDLPLLPGDEVMLEQLLSNLLENVVRHTPPATAVEISATRTPSELILTVRDHGPGFAPGEETKVFTKFHQTQTERAQSGFGLGLAICKAIVEAHAGTITASNAVGGGAEFRIALPLRAPGPTTA